MRLGLIGYGSIARDLLALLPPGRVSGVTVLVRRPPDDPPPGVTVTTDPAALIAARPGLVVECAGHGAVAAYGAEVLRAGIDLMVVSVGALADAPLLDALQAAEQAGGARLILPSGAIGGLDLLRALSAAGTVTVHYEGRKPPAAWKGSPAEQAVDLDALSAPATVFEGLAREAAQRFPKNANVVAALALAGPGFEAVQVRLVADPEAAGNTHRYTVATPQVRAQFEIVAAATSGNARTSQTTVLSVLAEVMDRAARAPRR
ncbi:aspartate dehydrogenase [Pseudoponticoccus marisrubri]|uniref:L-aspartate dehydrogenase n=1 Tax=Pseudoponticoccus marisrubri TaxID=1685382 RepID=A0A0W7WK83_9RHOB|nr:aspartate dehydrogenase [Pseudoponticoccus marisrubri]KUF10934.1 hypothetical protein AVJ23_10915 [Pseudoponticoccus marisrubri]